MINIIVDKKISKIEDSRDKSREYIDKKPPYHWKAGHGKLKDWIW